MSPGIVPSQIMQDEEHENIAIPEIIDLKEAQAQLQKWIVELSELEKVLKDLIKTETRRLSKKFGTNHLYLGLNDEINQISRILPKM